MEKSRVVCITGTGSYLPERVLTNSDLEKMVDTSDEWIRTRTGIMERRIAGQDELSSDMGAAAGKSAIHSAGIGAEDVDVIICASITPDVPFPSTACYIQNKMGAKNAFCFDLEGACSGFLYAMEVAEGLLRGDRHRTALVIGAEKMSYLLDWSDRSTCVLFGDGAGAVVMQSFEKGPGVGRGIMSSVLGADGSGADLLVAYGGCCREPASVQMLQEKRQYLKMGGNVVFKQAVRRMSESVLQVLEKAGLTMDDVACIIPHQANLRIITAIAEKAGVSMDKMIVNIDRVGNTTAASLPLALDEVVKSGRVKKGDNVVFVAFGAGFTWGAMIVEI